MKGYSRVGNIKRVLKLFEDMDTKGVKRSAVTFSVAIQAHAVDGDPNGARSFFEKMRDGYGLEPNVYTYNSMLNVCVNARNLERARSLFDEMSSSNGKQDRVTTNTTINVHAECCNKENGKQYLRECRKLLEEMEGNGTRADRQTYSVLLKLCTRGSLTAESIKILNEMRSIGMHLDVVSYSIVLDGISKNYNLSNEEVLELSSKIVNEMKKNAIRPNATSFTSLITIALRFRNLHQTDRLLKAMKTLKVKPTVVIYDNMIKCCEKLGDPNDGEDYLKPCLDLLEECEQAGMKMDVEGYISLLSACANTANPDQASSIWRKMIADKVKLDVFVYTAMINAFLSKDKEDRAFEFYDKMNTSGIKPDVLTYETSMSYFERKKDKAGAEKILDEMKIQGVQPDKGILKILNALGVK